MTPFTFARASDTGAALQLGALAGAKYLGGGTNLVDLMRETIERPASLVDVTGLGAGIDAGPDGGVVIGAAARNTAMAEHTLIRTRYPVLSRAILAGASGQIRNMATLGGNLLQRTRCGYFYDGAARCNKRAPQTGCDALDGLNRIHAILGASPACVATNPSDMCVALAALDATVQLDGPGGPRSVAMVDFHLLPGGQPQVETVLRPGELIVSVTLPALPAQARSTYRKVRDRASYAFALVSVGAVLELDEGGMIHDVRIALGGVALKPWRAAKAEAALRGQAPSEANLTAAAAAELADAAPLAHNGFKVELARRVIVAVLGELAGERA